MRPHRALQTTLGGLLRNTGAHVELERAIPELFTWQGLKRTEAILDEAIRWPTSLHTTVADVTARCPHASRHGRGGTASSSEAAEDEKHKRYRRVTPIASRPTDDSAAKDETLWKPWQQKHAGTATARAPSGTMSRSGEKHWNRTCCTRKQTSRSSPSAPRAAQGGRNTTGRPAHSGQALLQADRRASRQDTFKPRHGGGQTRRTACTKLSMRAKRTKGGRRSKRDGTGGTAPSSLPMKRGRS